MTGRVFRHAAGLALLLGAAAAAGAAPPIRPAAVLEHPRWVDTVAAIRSRYAVEVRTEALQGVCLRELESLADPGVDDAVAHCIRVVLAALDGSGYIPPKEHAANLAEAKRRFVGIGLELGRKERGAPLVVVTPIAGAPAQRAGIRAGDRIVEVDGVDLLPLSVDECVAAMRGEPGSVMRLALLRGDPGELQRWSITREEIRVMTARAARLPGGVVWARVSQLARDAGAVLAARLQAQADSRDGPPIGLVLDLRGNTGGTLDELVAVASALAPAGVPVVAVSQREGTQLRRTGSDAPAASVPRWQDRVPLVVLVDERTAAGAEALAQFLRESRAALLMGRQTMGREQVHQRLTVGGDAAISLVIGRLASPQGAGWKGGLVPDRALGAPPERFEWGDAADAWLREAAQAVADQRRDAR